MHKDKIGRNDPCPCGSGKKYKKCCISIRDIADNPVEARQIRRDEDFIPIGTVPDNGLALFDDKFLEKNRVHEISSHRLIYSCLLRPEIDGIANQVVRKFVDRGKEELQRIESADVRTLVEIMKNNPDMINHNALIDRLVSKKAEAVPLILDELRKLQNDSFVEIAVKAIHRTKSDCSADIINIIQTGNNRKAYAISLLCVLLGFFDNVHSEKLLWDHYHFLKGQFPDETYSDGPLLGLSEMRERRK